MNTHTTTQREPTSESTTEPAVSIENLTKEYGDVTAVDGISFDVEPGSVVGLLGPNGAGKTTTIKMLLGTVVPDDGTVEISGTTVQENLRTVHRNVGMMFEGSRDAYWRLTVRENLEFFTRLNGVPASLRRERHDELLDRLDLTEKADVPVRKLSRGMKQKVAVASTLSKDIDVAFLDEPTLGLDVETTLSLQTELRNLVNDEDLTVILTSHNLDVIENICDRVVILSEGSVLADDSVDSLLEEFETDTYRVVLESALDPDAFVTLESDPDIELIETNDDSSENVITVRQNAGGTHELSTCLHDAGCSVRSLRSQSPDLKDVFLELTNHDT